MLRSPRHLRNFLIGILAVQAILLVISLPGQRIQNDEAAFAEIAYWGAKDGHMHSELFRGLTQYEDRILLYHKAHEWLGVLAIQLCGFGLWPLRSLSLIATAVLVLLLYSHSRRDDEPDARIAFLVSVAVLALAPLTFKFAKFYRPEMMQAALGLGSYLALRSALRDHRMLPAIVAGLAAGLAMLTHLNGVIYVLAGGVLLLSRKRWGQTIVFGVFSAVAFAPFFYEIIGRFDLFWHQYTFDPTFGENERTIWGTLLKLAEEHKRLFRKPEIVFTSILFFTSLFADAWRRRGTRRDFYVYTAVCMIALGTLAPAKTTPYAILLLPLFAIQVGFVVRDFWRSPGSYPAWRRYGLGAAIVVFLIHSVAADTINAVTDKQNWVDDNRRLAEHLDPDTWVLAPLDFVFDELPTCKIAGLRLAQWRIEEWEKKRYTFSNLVAYADSIGMTAIILDKDHIIRMELQNAMVGDVYYEFRVEEYLRDAKRLLLRR